MGMFEFIGLGVAVVFLVFGFIVLTNLRRVVATNEVHIVQSRKKTTSYGKDTDNGNVYYKWPEWLPFWGVKTTVLPTSNFTLSLDNYEAYDKGRLPFLVDVAAFFRIADSNVAAQRISSSQELVTQLTRIVQGAVRSILASSDIEEIMQGRSTFGEQFTKEVKDQLVQWGVETVKNMELMDLRDSKDNHVIKNIMEKKKSHIESESRQVVTKNMRDAQIAETQATREVELQKQEALQQIGLRKVEVQRQIDLSNQAAMQSVKEQERISKEKEMAILSVQETRKAEILKQVTITQAQQEREQTVILAEGQLEAKRKESEAITLEGAAKAEASKAMQLAPVQAQITLAKEIGENESYQKYLLTLEQIKANQAVGIEQAKALTAADVKIISNTESPNSGIANVMDLFSSKGGTAVGAMLEGLANTEKGAEVVSKVLGPANSVANGSGKSYTNGKSAN